LQLKLNLNKPSRKNKKKKSAKDLAPQIKFKISKRTIINYLQIYGFRLNETM